MSDSKKIEHIKAILPTRPQRAVIREDECIGCTKCIPTCPTDAILGARKQMHTVITDACTGCELCVTPCPVDCIDIIPLEKTTSPDTISSWQTRYEKHQQRPANRDDMMTETLDALHTTIDERKEAIQAAIQRAKRKKHES